MSRSLGNMIISIRQLLMWWNMTYAFYLDGIVTSMGLGAKVYQGSSVSINTQGQEVTLSCILKLLYWSLGYLFRA